MRETLGDEVSIRTWVINKLPNDAISVENAIMLYRSNRWPLMIDPQGQANRWVKNFETVPEGVNKPQLKVIKQSSPTFVRVIEAALQFGNPVLLENIVETIDPVLEPVLLKQVVVIGGAATIKLGDATVDYDPKFRLYLTTKLRNPHYPPELCVKVNLLNFMATVAGLEDQMQGIAMQSEQPVLSETRERLVMEDADNKRQLKEIEDTILHLLKNAEGNILDDEVLINTLAQSKVTSNIIEVNVKEAAVKQVEIAETRKGYQPVALHASILFFCIADLCVIDPMYQYSLDWFIGLFELGIENADQPEPELRGQEKLDSRIELINECFTYILYKNICRSLFEMDKLVFSFMLTTKIMLSKGDLDQGQLRYLLQGSTSMELSRANPASDWLEDKFWGNLLELESGGLGPKFDKWVDKFFMPKIHKWAEMIESSSPADTVRDIMGEGWKPFELLCMIRALRPDVVVPEIQGYVAAEMGNKYIEPPQLDLMDCYKDSKCTTPLIFVLTPGADPMTELFKVAEELGFGGTNLTAISLGQGQGPLAEEAITIAQQKGLWVCLQNCHLCVSWLPTLERICEELAPDRVQGDFRLWLTSEPSPAFPAFILQNGVKMTIEPPKGIRASLFGSWSSMDEKWFDTCNRPHEFKKILFGLTFLHAVNRERLKFGPLGWNVKYVFSGPDLKISIDQLRVFLDELPEGDDVPYAALAYLAGECNYGGRVTDDKDRRALANFVSEFYNPDILEEGHVFSISGIYYAPPEGPLAS